MALKIGTRIGPYEITAPVGAGGMGEVYRAKDTRLDRVVAIKVLSEALTADTGRRQRLEREAKAISRLSHPHVCTLYDIGREGDLEFLVMEYIDGESLASRLGDGALPIDEVLLYGVQMADALAAAHRQGIVHRDLKPGNIMLTRSGAKLLDFGLARMVEPRTGDPAITQSPTLTAPLTEEGAIVGTYQYMAPEQLEGRPADARADIFALGSVLYEMATGRRAFSGSTRASLISSILREEPTPISSIQAQAPRALSRVVEACLRKDPDERWQSAADLVSELRWAAEGDSPVGDAAAAAGRRRPRESVLVAASILFAALFVVAGIAWWRRAPQPSAVVRFEIAPPAGLAQVGSPRISPDGRSIAFWGAGKDGTQSIWLRTLDDLEAHPLAGTEGAQARPFWSPDSRSIAFMAGGKLKQMPIRGGPPQIVCDAPTLLGGAWSAQGAILFDGWGRDPIQRVSSDGGTSAPIIEPKSGEGGYFVGLPALLPDGEHFLYVQSVSRDVGVSSNAKHLMLASLKGGETPRKLLDVDSQAQYVAPGYLIYVREDSLLAQPFDAKTLRLAGPPVSLVKNLPATRFATADFSASDEGTLAYRAGFSALRRLVWVDRSGKELAEEGEREWYLNPALSPDGKRLAVEVTNSQAGGQTDIWLRDLDRGPWTRLTFEPAVNAVPLWSPDGRRIVFTSLRPQGFGLYVKSSSGLGAVEPILKSDHPLGAISWSPDGRWLLAQSLSKAESWDIMRVQMEGPGAGKITPFVATKGDEREPHFSPDGRWVVYESTESGRMEIYVRPFEGPQGKWQVSADGGVEPWWSADGKEIFYLSPDSFLMAVPVSTGDRFSAGIPKPLFKARLWETAFTRNRWLPARDGQRFLLLEAGNTTQQMTVVQHWPQLLAKR